MADVEYLYFSGQPSNVIPQLRRSLGQYHRRYEYVKIGITIHPEIRFGQHLRNEKKYCWEKMVVKYQTTSVRNANAIEKYFIYNDYYLTNDWTGESHMSESPVYYAYILLGNHRYYKR